MSRARRWTTLLAALLGGGLLYACGTSGYHYVSHASSRTYFKVPGAWKLFNQDQIIKGESASLSPQQQERSRAVQWVVAFDGDPRPSIGHVLDEHSKYPMGFARVRTLNQDEQQTYNLAALHNEVLPLDRMAAIDGRVEPLLDKELVKGEGLRGSRLVNNIKGDDGYLTLDQSALLNPRTHVLYVLVIGCEAQCYVDNQRQIDDIVHSWTVKER